MRRAILLSAFGLGTTSPTPPVGCVIFDRAGRPVSEGHHERKGEAHAETLALSGAGPAAAGGTAVATLEPCNHFGRTPPCHQALIDAGIRRVVIGVLDPTSRGEGGAVRLRAAAVRVEVGVGEQEARLVLCPWLAALHTGRPTVAWADQVLDGDVKVQVQTQRSGDGLRHVTRLPARSGRCGRRGVARSPPCPRRSGRARSVVVEVLPASILPGSAGGSGSRRHTPHSAPTCPLRELAARTGPPHSRTCAAATKVPPAASHRE